MRYWLDLFTPKTWLAFRQNGCDVSGFREGQRRSAEKVRPGDKFLCYIVGLSRWCGVLTVNSKMYVDDSPYFDDPDPFIHRFEVSADCVFDFDKAIPIFEPDIWNNLEATRHISGRVPGWAQTANLRASLREIELSDASVIADALQRQAHLMHQYPLDKRDERRIRGRKKVRAADREVIVEVPDEEETESLDAQVASADVRQSIKIQASLCAIGSRMGLNIWVPRADRQAVAAQLSDGDQEALIDILPLNYDDATLRTIEQIDVIWLKKRSMARAFEVEHTTAIYSGLLRMADLLALQPNMDIRLHIVAPEERRDKVLREISRPVFSLLDRGPLYESCSYLSYEAVEEISSLKHLEFMVDAIIEQYEENVEEEDE